jgi:hypothetical protein
MKTAITQKYEFGRVSNSDPANSDFFPANSDPAGVPAYYSHTLKSK